MKDLDFLLVVGHLFTLVVYGQLILEQADLIGLDTDLVDSDLRRPDPRLLPDMPSRCMGSRVPSRRNRIGLWPPCVGP